MTVSTLAGYDSYAVSCTMTNCGPSCSICTRWRRPDRKERLRRIGYRAVDRIVGR